MREMAKSMLGLSWAISVFSAQQLSKLVAPSQEALEGAIAEVEEVSRFVQSRVSEAMGEQFRAGDEWQRRLIDAAFSAGTLDPRPLLQSLDGRSMMSVVDPSQMIKTGVSLVQQTAETGVALVQQTAETGVSLVQQTAEAVRKRTPGISGSPAKIGRAHV